jgi:type II secretory pathway pseudopilin PulG
MRSGSARRCHAPGAQQGFFYVGLLIFVAIVAIGLNVVSEVWVFSAQREREAELLFIGNQYRDAITRYYVESPRGARKFPKQLSDLLEDNRGEDKVRRYLRRMYVDPMTGQSNWGEVTLVDGSIVGVYSRSLDAPIKVSGFKLRDAMFADQTRYTDWVFRSSLPAANPVLANGQGYSGGQSNTPPIIPAGPIRGTPGSKPSSLPRLR